jgi:hypothetical protein
MTLKNETIVFHSQAFFAHYDNLMQYIPEREFREFEEWANHQPTQMQIDGVKTARAQRVVTSIYHTRPVELAVWLMTDRKVGESELVTMTQAFYFRKISETRRGFRAQFAVSDKVSVEGRFSTSRVIGDTGLDMLSGRRRLTVLGHAHVVAAGDELKIEITPLFIGRVVERAAEEGRPILDFTEARRQLWPDEIDQFNKIKDAPRPTAAMRTEVSEMHETKIKECFAEIIGEPYVGKDWGGETSDLYSARLTMGGKPLSVAFAFKGGRGKKGKLTVGDMGKNGDQGLRLFEEPIDLGIVQHHTEIVSAVSNLLEAVSRLRGAKYMVIDGNTTAQILGAYGYLTSLPKSPEQTPQ